MSKLSNTDFRSLVNQADKDVLADAAGRPRGKKPGKATSTGKERHKQRYIQILKRQKQKEQKSATDETGEPRQVFRDRAAERRQKLNEHVKGSEEVETIQNVTIQNVTEEESKYLGGDIEHTHLVKGLDFVLLSKVRSEIEQKEAEAAAAAAEATSVLQPTLPIRDSHAANLARKICHELTSGIHPHHISYERKLNKVDAVALRGAQFRNNTKNFLPGRMTYVFKIVSPSASNAVPVTIFQSPVESEKANHSSQQPTGFIAPVHWRIVKHLNHIFGDGTLPSKKKIDLQQQQQVCEVDPGTYLRQFQSYLSTLQPFSPIEVLRWLPTRTDAEKPVKSATDDDDIFGGVGHFDPSEVAISALPPPPVSIAEEADTSMNHRTKYFDENPDEEQIGSGTAKAVAASHRRMIIHNQTDEYEECYPDLGQHSEDEEEEGKKKRKAGKVLETNEEDKKKTKLTSRALRRQEEREWKKLEGYIETKKHRDLDIIEKTIDNKKPTSSSSKQLPAVLQIGIQLHRTFSTAKNKNYFINRSVRVARDHIQNLSPTYLTKFLLQECRLTNGLTTEAWARVSKILLDTSAAFTQADVLRLLEVYHHSDRVDVDLYRAMALRVIVVVDNIRLKTACQLAYGFCRLGVVYPPLYIALRIAFIKNHHVSLPDNLALMALAYGRLGLKDEALFDCIADRTIIQIAYFLPDELATLLLGFALVNYRHPNMIQAALRMICQLMYDMTPDELAYTAFALARLDIQDELILSKLETLLLTPPPEKATLGLGSSPDVVSSKDAWILERLGANSTDDTSLTMSFPSSAPAPLPERSFEEKIRRIDSLESNALADLAMSTSTLGIENPALLLVYRSKVDVSELSWDQLCRFSLAVARCEAFAALSGRLLPNIQFWIIFKEAVANKLFPGIQSEGHKWIESLECSLYESSSTQQLMTLPTSPPSPYPSCSSIVNLFDALGHLITRHWDGSGRNWDKLVLGPLLSCILPLTIAAAPVFQLDDIARILRSCRSFPIHIARIFTSTPANRPEPSDIAELSSSSSITALTLHRMISSTGASPEDLQCCLDFASLTLEALMIRLEHILLWSNEREEAAAENKEILETELKRLLSILFSLTVMFPETYMARTADVRASLRAIRLSRLTAERFVAQCHRWKELTASELISPNLDPAQLEMISLQLAETLPFTCSPSSDAFPLIPPCHPLIASSLSSLLLEGDINHEVNFSVVPITVLPVVDTDRKVTIAVLNDREIFAAENNLTPTIHTVLSLPPICPLRRAEFYYLQNAGWTIGVIILQQWRNVADSTKSCLLRTWWTKQLAQRDGAMGCTAQSLVHDKRQTSLSNSSSSA